ncbi:DUF1573 domain-containing protein [Limibacter armeniacum]|uniref:DUF1573 domain-containing protein n=1 Tax=Limibacter armeniacum TaxID=466084 RepID=UPI002FE55FC3
MKKITKIIGLCALSASMLFACNAEKEKSNAGSEDVVKVQTSTGGTETNEAVAAIEFEEKLYDFGDIQQGDVVEHIFKFTNSGSIPLQITNVKTTCGCTAPEWPKEAVAPGETGDLKVVFNSRGKVGQQNKAITIYANIEDGLSSIKITGNVVKEETAEGPVKTM